MVPLAAVSAGEGPTVVLVHGFTQTSASMQGLASALGASRRVVAVDLPGHGGSSGCSADLDEAAALVVEAAGGAEFDVVGYSLGGRVALHVACLAPPTLRGTVAISASPGVRDEALRLARLDRDLALADALEHEGDLEAFLGRWLANPMFATLPVASSDVEGRLQNTPAGLADSLRRCSLGTQRWLGGALGGVETPVLMLCGARDDPFVAAACAVARSARAVTAMVVPGSGHVCHLEQPRVTSRLIEAFLAR